MTEDAEARPVSDTRKASPWPMFVALGLAVGEVGVFLALYPVAVAGLLLFVGSVAGIVTEAGYTERPWTLLAALGGVLVVGGLWVVSTQITAGSLDGWLAAIATTDTIVLRGFSITAAGLIALVGSAAGQAVEPDLAGANQ